MNLITSLDKLLSKFEYEVLKGDLNGDITELLTDTRKVSEGSLFVCIKGVNYDPHEHIDEIANNGAKVIVVEKGVIDSKNISLENVKSTTVVAANDTRSALGYIAAEYFDHPADKMKIIGVTGTKGKTTTTYMVKSVLESAGLKVGLIGTIEIVYEGTQINSVNTTPDSMVIEEQFARMVDVGCDACVMEVSSQAMLLHRVDGFTFEIGIFTNISPDHIGPNEHDSFEDYLYCKSLLFTKCRYAIINGDDEHASYILNACKCDSLTYGLNEACDLQAYDINLVNDSGLLGVTYRVKGELLMDVRVNMPGTFSVYNSMCAIAICNRLGVNADVIKKAIESAKVKGRIEMLDVPGNYTLMIDYAHNAMSLKALLISLREYNPKRLVALFGCGGNRAKGRRYAMGSVSARFADFTIITSDNPRDEEPDMIIKDIIAGYALGLQGKEAEDIDDLSEEEVNTLIDGMDHTKDKYIMIADRIEAIRYIMNNFEEGDLVVLAGKGHEDYQIIKGKKNHLDEREVVADIADEIISRQGRRDK